MYMFYKVNVFVFVDLKCEEISIINSSTTLFRKSVIFAIFDNSVFLPFNLPEFPEFLRKSTL